MHTYYVELLQAHSSSSSFNIYYNTSESAHIIALFISYQPLKRNYKHAVWFCRMGKSFWMMSLMRKPELTENYGSHQIIAQALLAIMLQP